MYKSHASSLNDIHIPPLTEVLTSNSRVVENEFHHDHDAVDDTKRHDGTEDMFAVENMSALLPAPVTSRS